jgi:transcription elongation factor GreB
MHEAYYITRGGYARFVERMKAIAEKYEAVVSTNETAADAGDNSVWHDNFSYEENQRDMHKWAQAYRSLENTKEKLVIVEIDPKPDAVKIGCTVVLYDVSKDKAITYSVVGFEDGDPGRNRISYTAPLAKALLGSRVGEICRLEIGREKREYEILEIYAMKEE